MSKDDIKKAYRPHGWDDNVAVVVKECIEAGDIEIDDDNRAQVEGFVRHCVEAGASLAIKGIRDNGIDAMSLEGKILIPKSKVLIPGRSQYKDPGITSSGYKGPGKLSFIPADQTILQVGR